MKYIFTSMLLLMIAMSKAQIVNIPDNNFKYLLLQQGIDLNQDNEIQTSEALQVTRLSALEFIYSLQINSVTGLEAFTNLVRLDINVSAPIINISGLNNLQDFLIDGPVKNIDMTGCTSLNRIVMTYCDSISSFDISSCFNLKELSVNYCKNLSGIIMSNNDSLKTISIGHNISFTSIDLTNCSNLEIASFSYNDGLGYINLAGLNKLQQLHIQSNTDLYSINVNGCNSLQYLSFTVPPINFPPLNYLDLSSCINLSYFASNGLPIKHLNVKNGSGFIQFTYDAYSSVKPQICADEFEIDELIQRMNASWMEYESISSYCTFFPGGNANTIKGKVKLDANNNGCDSSDRGMQQVAIKIRDTTGNSLIRYSAISGDYAHYSYKGLFTLTPYFPYAYFTVNPNTTSASFDTANNLTSTKDFCIQPNGIHNDLEITFLPTWPAARPGFDANYTLVYKNRGTTTLSGNVSVNFDNSKMNFVSASENIASQSTGQLTWNYNNLQPFESKTINVTFNLLPPPVNNIGDTITYLAAITPSANDETTFDNSFILPQRVIGSFDPNDKQCLEGSKLDISKLGDYLHYQINFQNEGTDTAFNVVVTDTLSDKLDWNTFEFVSSSHTCNPTLKNEKIEFIFENIHLPYKAINEPGSNGWVAFKIKPKPSVVIGDSVNNKAAIYFDFNKPVITNTATTIVTSSSTPVPVKLEYFSVNQKNNTNVLNWKASCSYGNAVFVIERSEDGIHFSSMGNVTASALRCQLPLNFTDNNPLIGKNYYRLKITDADGISFYSKILVIGNGKTGLQITAVANNFVYLNSNKQQTVQIKVIAADGKEISNEQQTVTAGNNSINLQMKNTVKGIYTLILYTTEGAIITKRFIK